MPALLEIRTTFLLSAALVMTAVMACGVATPTSSPYVDAERLSEQEYIQWLDQLRLDVTDTLAKVETLLARPKPTSAAWREEVNQRSRQLVQAHGDAHAVSPPVSREERHNSIQEALDELAEAGSLLLEWLVAGPPELPGGLLDQVSDRLEEGRKRLGKAGTPIGR